MQEAADREWGLFKEERTNGIEEISQLRQKVAEELERKKSEKGPTDAADKEMVEADADPLLEKPKDEAQMDVDDAPVEAKEDDGQESTADAKEDSVAPMQADDDDAVEY